MKPAETDVKADFHMHTEFSGDSDAPVRTMLDAALERGMEAVCITDHIDEDYPEDSETGANPFLFDLDQYFQVLREIKKNMRTDWMSALAWSWDFSRTWERGMGELQKSILLIL